ncbi:HAD family hydrolase [Mesomycoplasma lagogenitalium]|uniref:HAD family hydrolase n=1 Tax=Mesomycoplasma lagogenitalium TaxID=171286 RepID=A0ABY8LVV8_9BACT|nr:HAD family hydrolase [Mesomycoplasma lagogenitalium]WGI36408.1 HAD family hydrolase [Mesomycoplasma lagogenitalium]
MDKNLKTKIKNIFLDLDGTTLTSNKEISQKTISILKKMQKEGKTVSIVTGRPVYFAKEEYYKLNCDFPIIGCNGALVYDFKNDKLVYKNPINKNISEQIFQLLVKNNITFLMYTTSEIYGYSRENYQADWFNWLKSSIEKREKQFQFNLTILNSKTKNDFDIKKFDIVKFLVIKSDSQEKDIENIKPELTKFQGVYIIQSQEKVIDIMPEGSSKGYALEVLSKTNNFNLEETLVFGDEQNDVSMFEVAKYSVAMGQSKDVIKEKATFITDSNNDEGIFNFINKYLK